MKGETTKSVLPAVWSRQLTNLSLCCSHKMPGMSVQAEGKQEKEERLRAEEGEEGGGGCRCCCTFWLHPEECSRSGGGSSSGSSNTKKVEKQQEGGEAATEVTRTRAAATFPWPSPLSLSLSLSFSAFLSVKHQSLSSRRSGGGEPSEAFFLGLSSLHPIFPSSSALLVDRSAERGQVLCFRSFSSWFLFLMMDGSRVPSFSENPLVVGRFPFLCLFVLFLF